MALINWTSAFQTTPAGTDAMSVVDDRIRELKEQISRRLEQGGHGLYDDPNAVGHGLTPASANDGRHVVDSGGAGIGPDIYKDDGTTKLVTYTNAAATMVSGSTWIGTNVTNGNNPGHGHDVSFVVYIPQVATGRVPGVMFHNLGNGTIELLDVVTRCWTAPGAATLTTDMHRLDNTYTDPTSTATPPDDGTIFTTPPIVASGNFVSAASVINTGGSMHQLAVGEAWVFEIVTNDTADDIFMLLKVRRV